MKPITLIAGLMMGIALALPLRADPPAWTVLWFPWNTTYASWDWASGGSSITIESTSSTEFPASVKTWDLAVCSASDPVKKVLVPLPNPLSIDAHGNRTLDLGLWTPGGFAVGQLDALGEGTFLCAVLGDGQRCSNVSRVTISHDYQRAPTPGVRVYALPFPDQDIRRIAVRIVLAPGDNMTLMDLAYPAVSINGSWSCPKDFKWAGQNPVLQPGTPYVQVVSLDNYDPPIAHFKKADVQLKVISDFRGAFNALPARAPGQDRAAVINAWLDEQPGFTSLVSTLTATETDAINFDLAFVPK